MSNVNGHPSLGVAITTYNQRPFIAAAIESVLTQTRGPMEVVVVDDGSSDGTSSVIESFRNSVRYVRQDNGGVAAARNRAILESSADYVALLDGDDLWAPGKLERCWEAISENPGVNVIIHDVDLVSSDATVTFLTAPLSQFMLRAGLAEAPQLRSCWADLIEENFVYTTSQVVVRRQAYLDVGMSDRRFRIGSDYDLYLRLARLGRFFLIPEVLAQWRQHDRSASGAGRHRMFNWQLEMIRVLQKHAGESSDVEAMNLRDIARQRVEGMQLEAYRSEMQNGPLSAASDLARIAVSCKSPLALLLAIAVFTPQRLRHLGARLIGRTLW